jgi:hypothetical protein
MSKVIVRVRIDYEDGTYRELTDRAGCKRWKEMADGQGAMAWNELRATPMDRDRHV